MRVIALLPMLLVIVSLVLTILCILAGYQSTFLEGFELVTFNTSQLGATLVNRTAAEFSSAAGSLPTATTLPSTVTSLPPSVTSLAPSVQSEIAQLQQLNATEIAEVIAGDLNIHDFYKIHILDYCEGYYTPGPVPNASFSSDNIKENLTFCSNPAPLSFFNASQVSFSALHRDISDMYRFCKTS